MNIKRIKTKLRMEKETLEIFIYFLMSHDFPYICVILVTRPAIMNPK